MKYIRRRRERIFFLGYGVNYVCVQNSQVFQFYIFSRLILARNLNTIIIQYNIYNTHIIKIINNMSNKIAVVKIVIIYDHIIIITHLIT